jgi:four helix bundle protein
MKTLADLDIYKDSLRLFLKVHPASFKLPKSELYELGSQLRRSADSVVTNIVEGYGRSAYKSDFIKFLTYAKASNLETLHHLEKLSKLYPDLADGFYELSQDYDLLGAKLYKFISYVSKSWNSNKLKPITNNR